MADRIANRAAEKCGLNMSARYFDSLNETIAAPEWREVGEVVLLRNAKPEGPERKQLSRVISKMRRTIRRRHALTHVLSQKRIAPRLRRHVTLLDDDGSELTTPVAVFQVISRHYRERYGDEGQDTQAWRTQCPRRAH